MTMLEDLDADRSDASPAPLAVFGDDDPLPDVVHRVATELDVDALSSLVVTQCSTLIFPLQAKDAAFLQRLGASVRQNAVALRDVLAGVVTLEEVALEQVLSFATVQAQLRIPQKSMQRSYRISFYVQWHAWTGALRSLAEREGLSAADSFEALERMTQAILGYQDHVASQVAETYTRDYEALNRSRAHVRRNLVRDILRGGAEKLSASDLAILAYPLDRYHIAVLLPTVAEGAAAQVADGLRSATRAQQSLIFPISLTSTAVWLSRMEPWHTPALGALQQVLGKLGVVAGVSSPAHGCEGFRLCLRQAEEAERVRCAWHEHDGHEAPSVVRYADAGLEVLLMQNDELARAFVRSELGDLANDTAEAARLRETLEASFRFGSHVAAAEHLKLHEHTVRNRLHKAEEILGHGLQDRRTELQVAIRMLRVLGDGHAQRSTRSDG